MNPTNDPTSPVNAILVPIGQAIPTGLLSGILVGLTCQAFHLENPALIGAISGVGAALAIYQSSISNWRSLVWTLAVPPSMADPQPAPEENIMNETVTIRVQDTPNHTTIANLPASLQDMITLAQGLQSGIGLNEQSWTGADQPFSRSQFHQIRDTFIRRGWAQWNNPTARAQGLVLTNQGWAVVRYLANGDARTLPSPAITSPQNA